jgi:hypothetical protein
MHFEKLKIIIRVGFKLPNVTFVNITSLSKISLLKILSNSVLNYILSQYPPYSQNFKIFYFILFFLWRRTPPKQGHFVYILLSGKLQTHVKRPLHTDRVKLRLRWRVSPKQLFTPKGIQTLDLMGLPQRPRLLPLEPTP